MPSKSKSLNKTTSMLNNSSMSSKSSNSSDTSNYSSSYGVVVFMFIVALGISFFILNWLVKVDKCKCANIEEAKYLKEWYMFLIVYQVIFGIYMLATYDSEQPFAFMIISFFVSIIAFVMIIRLVIYIHKLKEIKCNCGMTIQENIIYYWYIVVFSIVLFVILLTILGALSTLFLYK
jgi:hypothetical protein